MLLYRALLHLYPASWRVEYGEEMRSDFAARLAARGGVLSGIGLWLEALADLFSNAIAVHADVLRQDLRYAARTLRRSPGFTVAAVAIAAAGIGATTAAFTMVHHVFISPLPFAEPEQLVKMAEDRSSLGSRFWDTSPANYRDWKRMSASFVDMAAYRGLSLTITGQGEPQRVEGASVTAGMFPILGVPPLIGRLFNAGDDRDAAQGTVILSYGLWTSEFGGDPAVLGRTIRLDDTVYTVIGVMPGGFYFPNREARYWTAMRWAPANFEDRTDTYIYAVARLKPGVSVAQAQAEMRTVGGRLAQAYPKEMAQSSVTVLRLREDVSAQSLLLLKVLLSAALCVLLIACANLASLLIARAAVRRRELAVRTALGAGRERLVRQMLTESFLVALAGGALGLLIAHSALPLLVRLIPVALPIAEIPPVDARVLIASVLLVCTTATGFGVVPALRGVRRMEGLGEGGRSGMGARRQRVRSAMVVVEVAGCLALLVSFGLLARALWRIQAVAPGFKTDHALTLRTSLPMPRYDSPEKREPFYRRVLGEARRLPGVTAAGYISFLPMVMRGGVWPVQVEGRPEDVAKQRRVSLRFVTPGLFRAMGVPLMAGRDVSEADRAGSPYVALVSESFVRRYWTGENPIGRRIDVGNHVREIIGVVGDVRVRGLERGSEPQVYVSWLQADNVSPWYAPKDLVVRTAGDPAALASALRRIIREADPGQPVSDVRTLEDIVSAETSTRRLQLAVLGAFGAIAFLLAAAGIHSLLSFVVAQRTREIGVRVALGAQPGDILALTVRDGIRLTLAGVAAGAALSYGAGRLLEALLAGVKPNDYPTFAGATAVALVMSLAGSLSPALRALRVDPTTAMRAE
jgi:putative ABC transport system permease protein